LKFVVLFVAIAAADVWFRLDTTGQHTSGKDLLFSIVLVVVVGLAVAAIVIHLGNQRARGVDSKH
jgi:hypothetical protein